MTASEPVPGVVYPARSAGMMAHKHGGMWSRRSEAVWSVPHDAETWMFSRGTYRYHGPADAQVSPGDPGWVDATYEAGDVEPGCWVVWPGADEPWRVERVTAGLAGVWAWHDWYTTPVERCTRVAPPVPRVEPVSADRTEPKVPAAVWFSTRYGGGWDVPGMAMVPFPIDRWGTAWTHIATLSRPDEDIDHAEAARRLAAVTGEPTRCKEPTRRERLEAIRNRWVPIADAPPPAEAEDDEGWVEWDAKGGTFFIPYRGRAVRQGGWCSDVDHDTTHVCFRGWGDDLAPIPETPSDDTATKSPSGDTSSDDVGRYEPTDATVAAGEWFAVRWRGEWHGPNRQPVGEGPLSIWADWVEEVALLGDGTRADAVATLDRLLSDGADPTRRRFPTFGELMERISKTIPTKPPRCGLSVDPDEDGRFYVAGKGVPDAMSAEFRDLLEGRFGGARGEAGDPIALDALDTLADLAGDSPRAGNHDVDACERVLRAALGGGE